MALESTTLAETAARVLRLTRAEPLEVLIYLIMRILLGICGAIGAYITLLIGTLIAMIPLGALAYLFWTTLHRGSFSDHVFMVAGWVVLGLILLALVIPAAIILFGCVYVFFRAYAIYFLAGRYPMLTERLFPMQQPYVYTPPPATIPPPDDDSGPSFPLDPAIA